MKKLTVSSIVSIFLIGGLVRHGYQDSPEEVVLYDIMEEGQSENPSDERAIGEIDEIPDEEASD
ncbi:MAG: hypothetical protein LBD11_04970 [Candidatus Peribacteria bacterium]|jgi:hypothetical protein|nr:hypothetical protein [Candidatus Peribacteria bacterium]